MSIKGTKDGVIITVFVKPGSPKFKIKLDSDDILVNCTEEPVKGRVNKELIKEFSGLFHLQVEIIFGATSRQKKLFVKGAELKEIGNILQNLL